MKSGTQLPLPDSSNMVGYGEARCGGGEHNFSMAPQGLSGHVEASCGRVRHSFFQADSPGSEEASCVRGGIDSLARLLRF